MKINFSSNGKITWEEFCTFMQLNFSEKEEVEHNAKAVIFSLPAKMEFSPHRTPIQRITRTGDNSFMIMSSDGIFSNWTSNGEMKKLRKDVVSRHFCYVTIDTRS